MQKQTTQKKQKIGKLKRPALEACKSCALIDRCQIGDSVPFDDYADAVEAIDFDKHSILTKIACLSELTKQEVVTNA